MKKKTRIGLRLNISSELRREIIESYSFRCRSFGASEAAFVEDRLPLILQRLRQRGVTDRQIALVAGCLSEYWVKCEQQSKSYVLIGAALHYLVDPNDVIPDYHLGVGYCDDVIVLNECLSNLRKIDRQLYQEIEESIQFE